jgi:two-component system response regulator BaeR
LDIKLPQQDGISLCKEIRAFSSIPIFMITSQVTEKDRLVGLSIGADDYICKPYSGKEVVARVKSFFRRQDVLSKTWITSKGFHLNEENLQIHYNGNLLDLTLCEYRVLATLLKKSGKVYSRTELIDVLHEDEREILNRTVDSHIKNLRHKLNKISPNKDIIQSVYGAGYKISID